MSYSRWRGREGWYVFWEAGRGDPTLAMWLGLTDPNIEDNVRCYSATYKRLDGISHDDLATLTPEASSDERQELMEYVREFCEDVKEEKRRARVKVEYTP